MYLSTYLILSFSDIVLTILDLPRLFSDISLQPHRNRIKLEYIQDI